MIVGDPHDWMDRFITVDERLLRRVLHLWPACVALLPGQPEEDIITINLVHLLSMDAVVRRICHFVIYQYEPFGTRPGGAKFSKRKIDIAVLLGPVLSWALGWAGVHVVGGSPDHIRIGRRTDRNRMRNAVR